MTLIRRHILPVLAGFAASARTAMGAEPYPSRAIRILVGFPAGGPVDIAAHLIASWLEKRLGQPCLVENQPGDSGNLATRNALKSAPDGSTLLMSGPVNTINTTLFPDLDFDFARDGAPVAGLYRVPLVLEVNPSLPIHSAAEFLRHAKAHPGALKVAYGGAGTPQHIGIELFRSMTSVDFTLIAHPGSTPALADLISGRADAMFDPLPSSIAHIRSGALRPLAVTSLSRSAALPDVPVLSDIAPGYEAESWFGLVAPRGTPAPVVERLNGEVNAALADAAIKARISELGGIAMPGSPEAFADFIAAETTKYAEVIRAARIPLQR